jgi:hypothetical protein
MSGQHQPLFAARTPEERRHHLREIISILELDLARKRESIGEYERVIESYKRELAEASAEADAALAAMNGLPAEESAP